jgi:hypothetical protein
MILLLDEHDGNMHEYDGYIYNYGYVLVLV